MKVSHSFAPLARRWSRAGRGNRWTAAILVCLSTLVGAVSVASVVGVPSARTHDELSYLLAADTYARGRLANPEHPMWRHFETPHVLQQPTYMSKYQPAQGAALALGSRLGGRPILGVWISAALMCAAVLWMLLAWLPPRWAIFGAVLTSLQFGMAGYWAQSYWGGAIAAAGGALLFGAFRRLLQRDKSGSAFAFGLGALILAFSRPFEGLILTAVAVVPLSYTWIRRGPEVPALMRSVLPLAVVGALGVGLLAVNNRAVSGDPLVLPYQAHTTQYGSSPLFIWQPKPDPPTYRHERLREFADWETAFYDTQQSVSGWFVKAVGRPLAAALDYFFGPQDGLKISWLPGPLILPFLVLIPLLRRRWTRYALGVVAVLFLALSGATYFVPHYVAAVACLWMYLVVEATRIIRVILRRRQLLRRAVVPFVLSYALLLVVVSTAEYDSFIRGTDHWFEQKEHLTDSLLAAGGEHLVLVEYEAGYLIHAEWVSNGAEIDDQPIIWARSISQEQDERLLDFYQARAARRLVLNPNRSPLLTPVDVSVGKSVSP